MSLKLRAATSADLSTIIEINESELPHVSTLSPTLLSHLFQQAYRFRIAETENGEVAAFILTLDQSASYESPNFLWFTSRYPRFVYIDRIVVTSKFQGLGAGRSLYDDVRKSAGGGNYPHLACEVNLQPPNPVSLKFHHRYGFKEVGQQDTEGGTKTVSMMMMEI